MDEIRIEGLELACIVGLRPRERRRKQQVRVDLRLYLDVAPAGRSGRIGLTCDYSRVVDEVARLLRFREYRLVEVATEELTAMLFASHPVLERVDIRLEKPQVFQGRARSASVRICRDRAQSPSAIRRQGFGTVEVRLETHEAGLYVLEVEPGATVVDLVPAPRQLAWLSAGELVAGGQRQVIGDLLPAIEGGKNPGPEPARVFICRVPPVSPAHI